MRAQGRDQRRLRVVAEAHIGGHRSSLVGPEATWRDRGDLGSDGDGRDEDRIGRADLEPSPPSGLPDEHRFEKPGTTGKAERHRPRQNDLVTADQAKKPTPGDDGCGNDSGHNDPTEPTHQIQVGPRSHGETEQEDCDDVGRAQHDRRPRRRIGRNLGPANDAQDPNRFTEAERQDVVGPEGEVDPGKRLPKRQPREHASPGNRAEEKRDPERRGRQHDLGRMGDCLIQRSPKGAPSTVRATTTVATTPRHRSRRRQ